MRPLRSMLGPVESTHRYFHLLYLFTRVLRLLHLVILRVGGNSEFLPQTVVGGEREDLKELGKSAEELVYPSF